MNIGTYISGVGHGLFILWALIGGFFLSSRDPVPLQATEVSLISNAEFAALTLSNDLPDVQFDNPQPVVPEIEDAAPEIAPVPEETPDVSAPVEVAEPEAEATPVEPEVVPTPQAEVDDTAPDIPAPPVLEAPPILADPGDTAVPDAAPRVAPVAAAPPAPDAEIADTVTEEVAPDESGEIVAEEAPATAPEEAATEIVTEAETPASAPTNSPRPTARPSRPTQVAEAPSAQSDPVAEAVAQAVANDTPTPSQPTGPPLTGSEKEGLRVAVSSCWNVGSLSSEAISTTVVVAVQMKRDGKPENSSIRMISSSGGSDAAAGQAFSAARRAIIRCGNNGFDLPVEKYSQWQDIEMTFNPEGMRLK
ncbi:MAG: energy transducer TonB [Marinosulfonomonas sp.]|nr:MAG: energy transducer TonB [Marinosulfonomonas sp.]